MTDFHQPVLLKEVIRILEIKKGKKYIDATVGGGGHTLGILEKGGIILGTDCDSEALRFVRFEIRNSLFDKKLAQSKQFEIRKDVFLARGNYKNLKKIAQKYNFLKVDGILFDLGLSSWQIEKSGRGFSFQKDEPLDMRFDKRLKIKACDLLNKLSARELYETFTKFGEELNSLPIAQAIIRARTVSPFRTTGQLAKVIEDSFRHKDGGKVNQRLIQRTKARIFQTLRIVVNRELENLKKALFCSVSLLERGGRIVVISYHSLEDRMVKKFFLEEEREGRLKILTKKPIRASLAEIKINPRAKSAKLRAALRI